VIKIGARVLLLKTQGARATAGRCQSARRLKKKQARRAESKTKDAGGTDGGAVCVASRAR